ncbi:MAG: DUF397 domain-containing protein [Actinomycetota bacterium]
MTQPDPSLTWIKSSYSNGGGQCVELASTADGEILARNSNRPDAGTIAFTKAEIEAFLAGAKDGEFDHLVDA